MPTINQFVHSPRAGKTRRSKTPALTKCPQRRGIIVKTSTITPRKPNSAIRKIARLRLFKTRRRIVAHIPGEGHVLQQYGTVFIRGGHTKDLPGVKYNLIRGRGDFTPLNTRKKARSKHGVKKNLFK